MTNERRGGATATPEVNAEAEAEKAEETKRDYAMVAVSVPLDLHEAIEAKAKEAKVGLSVFARRLIAGAMSFDITQFERTRRRGRVSGLSEEERKAANEKAQRERAATVRLLLERYRKGEIELPEGLIEQEMASAPKRERKAK